MLVCRSQALPGTGWSVEVFLCTAELRTVFIAILGCPDSLKI